MFHLFLKQLLLIQFTEPEPFHQEDKQSDQCDQASYRAFSGFWPTQIRRGAGFYFQARREVKVRRPPGKEEGKRVLSSISTSFPRHWKSRPTQRIIGDRRPPFVSPTKKSSLTISHSFPAKPPLFAIRNTTSAFPFYNIPRRPPFQSLRKNQYQSNQRLTSSVIFPAPGEFTRPIPQSPTLLK
ncbi:hypothetical protein NE237_028917 [Protea cynaroides]|uniref:Uncharacterized protein n=1 Tax=Protea cynaroides TaxID=273540 RepID=A0A9Q0JVL9_9MAGN|nr:hypothetical protein NE237_028917 [Protea cynaroides]